MIIQIDRQNDVPKITEPGKLVYSEKSDTLFIRTLKEGTKAIGGNSSLVETDPVFQAWLAGNPLDGYVPITRTITINGNTQDLSNDVSFTLSSLTQMQVQNLNLFF